MDLPFIYRSGICLLTATAIIEEPLKFSHHYILSDTLGQIPGFVTVNFLGYLNISEANLLKPVGRHAEAHPGMYRVKRNFSFRTCDWLVSTSPWLYWLVLTDHLSALYVE